MACDHYSFLPSPTILSVVDLQYILETGTLSPLPCGRWSTMSMS
jgi:hypothetical protein